MSSQFVISHYASIHRGVARMNGALWFSESHPDGFNGFARSLYRKLDIQYPKFYKMDNLSKLAILASELLGIKNGFKNLAGGPKVAVVLANNSSSIDTDRIFYDSINDPLNYFPAPAVFVYTLPNITIGEICIKNKFTGENAFFIFDRFDPVFTHDYVLELMTQGRADACICGWCNFDTGIEDAFFMLVEFSGTSNKQVLFNVNNINKLYTQT